MELYPCRHFYAPSYIFFKTQFVISSHMYQEIYLEFDPLPHRRVNAACREFRLHKSDNACITTAFPPFSIICMICVHFLASIGSSLCGNKSPAIVERSYMKELFSVHILFILHYTMRGKVFVSINHKPL